MATIADVGVAGGHLQQAHFGWGRRESESVAVFRLPLLVLTALVAFLAFVGSAQAKPSEHPFEIIPGSFHFTLSTAQAAAHSDWTTEFDFAHTSKNETDGDLRNVVVNLPAGFDANNTAVPTCSDAQLLANARIELEIPACPPASAVGRITLDFGDERDTVPIYNMEVSSFGVTAQLGFMIETNANILTVRARPGDLGLSITSPDTPDVGEIHDVVVTTWGIPASHEHDLERQQTCTGKIGAEQTCENHLGGPVPANIAVKPFLANPTSCGMFTASMKAESWEEPQPEGWITEPVSEPGLLAATDLVGPIAECERVPFDPSIAVQPSTRSAESPTGLEVSLLVPQTWESPNTIATANLKDTMVTLPEGMTANPSLAAGLGACTPQQYEAETSASLPGVGCPAESKIGSIEIETPLLAEKIPGAIYIATPYDNPFPEPEQGHPGGSLLALYVVAKDPEREILIKVAGKITPNPVTGQLVTTFDNTPQQPFTRFTLKFRPGATAPLVSPPTCGTHTTQAALTPWSAPTEPSLLASSFETTQGVHEGPCPTAGTPPFHPTVTSGTQNNAAGSYSPFYLRIDREDGEQEITRFSTTLPPGLTGNLTGIPFCPDADIEAAKLVTGAEEEANPSCPAASEIGHTIVEAGVGTVLAQTPGKIYLAGPYHGAPLSIVSITSAKVGPFDLGTVVIRFALDINPTTAQVEVSANGSDPIPHIIRGIVVHVRNIRVYMSRPNFILNPTDCTPQSITETIDGAGADPANPADQVPVTATAPFTAADCSSLQFKPAFSASTSAKASRLDGESLNVKLTMPGTLASNSNIHLVKVELPKDLPSRLTTLRKACLASVFESNPANCPPASIIGHAKAITPVLPVPLEGPAYFVSHGGEAFPSLIVVLQGYGFTIDLVGTTYISKQGVTSSTFKTVPDQPVTSFELTLPEGPYSALTSLGNPCKNKLAMPTEFVAQNGATIKQSTKIAVTGCSKAKKATHKKKRKSKRKRKGKKGGGSKHKGK